MTGFWERRSRTLLPPTWWGEIESLAFYPGGYAGLCVVHRLAFRTLLGFDPTPEQCQALYLKEKYAFERAAQDKIARRHLASEANFHLTSRDILRAMKMDPG
jgi:hypothetical protein